MKLNKSIFLIFSLFLIFFQSCSSTDSFNSNVVRSDEIIKKIANNENILLVDKTIQGSLNFSAGKNENIIRKQVYQNYIDASVTFINCKFENKVLAFATDSNQNAHTTVFLRNITFANCEFKDEVNFREAEFQNSLNMSTSVFDTTAIFDGCSFKAKNIYFTETIFRHDFSISNAFVNSNINFFKSVFMKSCMVQNTRFMGETVFSNSKFYGYTDFSNSQFFSAALFNYSVFSGKVIFLQNYFYHRAEFLYCEFKKQADFSGITFIGTPKFKEIKVNGSFKFTQIKCLTEKPLFENLQKGDSATTEIN